MKTLILGYTQSIFTKSFIENIMLSESNKIILNDTGEASAIYYDFYRKNKIKLIYTPFDTFILSKIPKVRALSFAWRYKRNVEANGPYDCIWIHYVKPEKFYYIKKYANTKTKIIASFWGSDIYRSTKLYFAKLEKYLEWCTAITVVDQRMKTEFQKHYGDKFNPKLFIAQMGNNNFEVIDQMKKNVTRKECKSFFEIPQDYRTITIGYNRSKGQQHTQILSSLKNLSHDIWNKTAIIIPWMYGDGDEVYLNEVKSLLRQIPVQSIIIDKFLSVEEIAKLTLATDLYINGQITDAFSASLQEYLYAGANVFNAKWLPYPQLTDNDIEYIEFADFKDLADKIREFLLNKSEPITHQNSGEIIKNISSWEAVRKQWLAALQC